MAFSYVGLFVTVASAAVSAISTYQQGKTNARIADMNADLANQEARQKLAIGKAQQYLQERQAAMELNLAMTEAQAARVNATAIDNERQANEARGREESRRQREEARKLIAEQGALFAGAGTVTTTGTPLALMAASVQSQESDLIDAHYIVNVESAKKVWEADLERYRAGRVEWAGAAQNAIDVQAAKISGIATQIGARNQMSQASIDREAGKMQKRQATYAAIGQFASGVASGVSAVK